MKIEDLTPERRALLLRHLQAKRRKQEVAIPKRSTNPPRASHAQERLWFLDQLEPESAAYNLIGAVRLDGPLDVDRLSRAIDAVVRRHETLRTTFAVKDGVPVQLISEEARSSLRMVPVNKAELGPHAKREAATPFDLAKGPLFRATLFRLAGEEHVLLLVMHHIVSDGWSMGVLLGEVGKLYLELATGKASTLAALPIQYADYAEWQRGWLADGELDRQLDYWRDQLADSPQLLELPTD